MAKKGGMERGCRGWDTWRRERRLERDITIVTRGKVKIFVCMILFFENYH